MCLIYDRISMIKNGTNPYFVKELETGYVVMGDHQHFKGYTLFLRYIIRNYFIPCGIRFVDVEAGFDTEYGDVEAYLKKQYSDFRYVVRNPEKYGG